MVTYHREFIVHQQVETEFMDLKITARDDLSHVK